MNFFHNSRRALNQGALALLLVCCLAHLADCSQAKAALPPNLTENIAGRHLSLDECFQLADKNNKEIQLATCNLPVAQAAIVIAKALPNPTFNMEYGWGPAWQYIIAGNNQQVGFTEEIQVAGRRSKKVAVAKSNYFRNALQIEALRFEIHNRVRRAYAELVAAESAIDLIKAQKQISERLQEISSKRYDAGKAPGSERMQAKLVSMQFAVLLNSAKGRLLQGSARLAQLIGETPNKQELIDVDGNSLFDKSNQSSSLCPDIARQLPALEKLLPAAWRQRKDLSVAIQQAYSNRKALTLAKTLRVPDPVVGFSYLFSTYKSIQTQYFNPNSSSQSTPTSSTGDTSSGGTGSSTDNSPPSKVPYQPGYLLNVSQETPIFNQYKGQINQANSIWLQQLKQNDLLYSQIATDIVLAYESVQAYRTNIMNFQSKLLPAAEKVANLSMLGYELGKTDLSAAILAQQQYQQTRSAYFDSVTAYQNAWADLEKAVGVPLRML